MHEAANRHLSKTEIKLKYGGNQVSSAARRISGSENGLGRRANVVRYSQEPVLSKSNWKKTPAPETTVPSWLVAVRAAESKKATDILVLDLSGVTSSADFFLISP